MSTQEWLVNYDFLAPLKSAQIESIFFRINYGIRGHWVCLAKNENTIKTYQQKAM